MWEKIKAIPGKAWTAIKAGFKQLASLVTDPQWDLDVFRVAGLAAYVVAGVIALKTVELMPVIDAARLGIGAGLASLVGGFGTALFGQARQSDATMQPPQAGK